MSAALLAARFAGATVEWELRNGTELLEAGALNSLCTDPLHELRRMELRAGATVEIPAAGLTPDELAYARECGWRLLE